MAEFDSRSLEKLSTCHPDLWLVSHRVVRVYPHKIIEGFRSEERQNSLYPRFTKVLWPNSKHNHMSNGAPKSLALDFMPIDGDWDDSGNFYLIAGAYRAMGWAVAINIRLGADWDSDADTDDQRFHDLGHVELVI